jgi:hypothetical protein
MYSIENSLPLVKLGQVDYWQADPKPDDPRGQICTAEPGREYQATLQERSAPRDAVSSAQNTSRTASDADGDGLTGDTSASSDSEAAKASIGGRINVAPVLKRMLVAVGLEASDSKYRAPTLLRSFATAPRFVIWFQWFQILVGWLLATLFIAGVSGIVHKE